MSTGTQTEVVMPQMGVSVSEGTVTKWLKSVGERVERDESLLEISTDKVDTEVPSPGEGVVAQILVQEGETVEVGTVLAVIAPEGAAPAPSEPAAPEPPTLVAAEQAAPEPATQAAADASEAAASETAEPTAPAPPPAPAAAPAAEPSGNGRTFVSPVVARIASEHGVDPTAVQGTGTGGRVTKKDILAFVESGGQAAAGASGAARSRARRAACAASGVRTGAARACARGPDASARCSSGSARARTGRAGGSARAGASADSRRRTGAGRRAPSRRPARRSSRCRRCARESPSTCAAPSTPPRT